MSKKNRHRPQVLPSQPSQPPARAAEVQTVQFVHHQGPLPPPEQLEHYNRVLPGAAERIFTLAERQAEHRRNLESTVVTGNLRAQARGQLMGAMIVMVAMVIGGFLIHEGRPTEGFVSMFVPLAAVAGLFIWGRRRQEEERNQKLRDVAQPPSQ
ncbi:MAG: DUF2335 domain-containing protein [Candidatus Eisenbacteria bacterium]|nr:DUF2335 domain-containing protein [Candidatus Eisenbacteria bacterium]